MTNTGNPAISFETKSQLAKLLATENISVQHNPNVKTAYFDIKNRNLVLPVWQNISDDLYDMLVVHEVGHALDTPEKAWESGIKNIVEKIHGAANQKAFLAVKDFMNVIEDARIDKRQKRRYPGSRKNYIAGYKELLQKNFFGTNDLNINDLPLIDRINIHFKVGIYNQIVKFTAEEKVFIDRIAAAETFDEVIQLTEEIYSYSHEKKEEESKLKNESNDFNDDGDEGEEESFQENENFSNDESSDDSDSSESDDSSDDDSELDAEGSADEDSDEEIESDQETIFGKSEDNEDNIPKSFTEEATRKAMNNLIVNSDYNYIYANLPKFNIDKIVDDYQEVLKDVDAELAPTFNKTSYNWAYYTEQLAELDRFLIKEKDAISFMVKEFELKKAADIHSRISIAKTGVLDTNKLYAHRYNEDIFRKLAILPQGKNHGFVMLLDWSGSMRNELEHTLKQLFSLTGFCKRVGIPFEVYLFRSAEGHDASKVQGCYNCKDLAHKQFNYVTGSIMFDAFKLRNVLSSRMNAAQYKKAQQYLWLCKDAQFRTDYMNSTPLNQAIYVATELVNKFRAQSKVQIVNTIVLTDGETDPIHSYLFNHNEVLEPLRKTEQDRKKGELYFIRDEISGKTYELSNLSWYSSTYKSTKMFLDILRNRTNTTTIGFYQFSGSYKKLNNCLYNYGFIDTPKNCQSWKEDKFISLSTAGYDEYYVVNCKQLLNDTDKLDVNATMTKAKIAKEFIRFSGKKSINRLLLSKFIGRIANVYKRVA